MLIEAGLDLNENGLLDSEEVDSSQSQSVCNGVAGPPGTGPSDTELIVNLSGESASALGVPNASAHLIRAYGLDHQSPRFGLMEDGGLYAQGQTTPGPGSSSIPVEGAGTRLMWYPRKAAFRAGHVDGTQWNDSMVGDFSVALGLNTRASGEASLAFGLNAVAAQRGAFAAGEGVVASGIASVALGYTSHTNARAGSFVFADRSVLEGDFRAATNHSANWL